MTNWKGTTLGEVCKVLSGSTPSTKDASFWDGEIAWITPKDLSGFQGRYISRGERNITDEGLRNSAAQLLPKNTILFSSRAPIGYVAIADNEVTTNQGFKNIVCDEESTHYRFMYYWLKHKADFIEKLSSGSTFSEASASLMRGLGISLPPLKEQKEIAEVLSSLDDKIEFLREENKTLEATAQTIFREWFVNFNFPNTEGKPYKSSGGRMINSELGEIPEGWRVGKLSDACSRLASGGTPSTKEPSYYGGEIDWFSTKELQDSFLFESDRKISGEGLNNSAAKIFPAGTVLMAIYAAPTVGRLGILTKSATFNQATCGFIADENLSCNEFIYLFLLENREELNGLANGAAQQNLSVGLVRNFPIILPGLGALGIFQGIIRPTFRKLLSNASQIQTLSRLRDTLLPKLMSGEAKVE